MIGRGGIYQQHRFDFYDKWFGHPLCNLGSVEKNGLSKPEWLTKNESKSTFRLQVYPQFAGE